MSQAWWRLYRTRHGVWFEVVAGHDGVVEEFNALTDKQAQKFLEVNANSLVERYFGPMPEARPFQFSRRTVITAVKVLEKFTQAEFSEFALELGPEYPQAVGEEHLSLRRRLNNLLSFIDQHPAMRWSCACLGAVTQPR